jgi:uncharacterized protein YdeI (YjbR/CyaY-like superfamily)
MEDKDTLYVTERKEWRKWLEKNHDNKKEIWLIYYKKHSKKPSIPYDDAVEEAICFGWIDSTVKRIDEEKYMQRYTPRRKDSIWSYTNVKRVKRMLEAGKITKAGMKTILEEVIETVESGNIDKTFGKKGQVIPKVLPTPQDLKEALAKNRMAKEHWEAWAPSHRRRYVYWIEDAKRPETRERRIKRVVGAAEENKIMLM